MSHSARNQALEFQQSGRPLVHPELARRGRCDGRSSMGWAMNVTSMPGQIRVAKRVCSFVRKTLGLLAWEAEFRSSCVSVGHTRLSCNCCVAPALGSTQPNKPRLRPGDPASRLTEATNGHPVAKLDVAQHSCLRPQKSAPSMAYSRAGTSAAFRPVSALGNGMLTPMKFNEDLSAVPACSKLVRWQRRQPLNATTHSNDVRPTGQGRSTYVVVWTVSYPLPLTLMSKDSSTSTKPVKTFRFRGISASVFSNENEKGDVFYKVSIVRTYKDGRDFKTTPTYSVNELPIVSLVTNQAFEFILNEENEQRGADNR